MDVEKLVVDAAIQALVNHNTEAMKGILRRRSHVNYDAPKRVRFPTVEDCIFLLPAVRLLPEINAAVPGNSNPFPRIKKNDVLSDILLHVATRLKDDELVRVILEKAADINCTKYEGATLLHIAVNNSDYELVKLLLENGTDVNRTDMRGQTALHLACDRESSGYELIRLLLENGADVTRTDRRRKTALHLACDENSSAIIKLLTEKSPAYLLNLVDDDGCTPLDYACAKHSPELVLFLLSRGSSVVVKDSFRDGPLMQAVLYNKEKYAISVASILLEAGAKIHHQLLIAAVKRAGSELEFVTYHPKVAANYPPFLDFCMLLIDRGCDLNAVDIKGKTALHFAVETNQEILVRKLLIAGNDIDIDKRDSDGFTPLRYAFEYEYRRLVDLLIISGASLRGRDWETVFETWRSYKLNDKQEKLLNYVIDNSKQCLTLENLCYVTIRKNIRNVEKDAIKLKLPPLLVERLQLKE